MSYADFDSRCEVCHEPVWEGDEIAKLDGSWVHTECYEDETGDTFEVIYEGDDEL